MRQKNILWHGFCLPVLWFILCHSLYLWTVLQSSSHTMFFLIPVASCYPFCSIWPSPSLHLAKSYSWNPVHISSSKPPSLIPQDQVRCPSSIACCISIIASTTLYYINNFLFICLSTLKNIGFSRFGTYQPFVLPADNSLAHRKHFYWTDEII